MIPTTSILAVFIFSFVIGFGAVVSPGPVSVAIVSQSPRRGWFTGPLVATGHSFLELLIVILIAFGLSSGLAHPTVQTVIALLGGALLTWMGGKMAWDSWKKRIGLPDKNSDSENLSSRQLVSLGMVTTISNPFWYAWWVTVAAGYLTQARALGVASLVAFYLGHISADFAWDTTLSTIVASGRRWISDRIYRGLILVAGVFLVYLGFVFLNQGVLSLL
jgi:threonine/homoserine/homoserine lactone efflux protein